MNEATRSVTRQYLHRLDFISFCRTKAAVAVARAAAIFLIIPTQRKRLLMVSNWYALKVRSHFEFSAAADLGSREYELFLPTYVAKQRRSRAIQKIKIPLFAGYLFCYFDIHKREPVLSTPGVQFVASHGAIPEPLDSAELAHIRTVVQSGVACEPYPYLEVGEVVRVIDGPLAGVTGRLTEIGSSHRLILSISLLRRSVAFEIGQTRIEPVYFDRPAVIVACASGM